MGLHVTTLPDPWDGVIVPPEDSPLKEIVAFLEQLPRRAFNTNSGDDPDLLMKLEDIVTWLVWLQRRATKWTASEEGYQRVFEQSLPTLRTLLGRLHRLPGGSASSSPSDRVARTQKSEQSDSH